MAQSGFKQVLSNGGFQAFLWTQFFGAFNDNVFRSIVGLRALHEQNGRYASLVVGVFVLPSLLFSGYAGHLADAISKRRVLIAVKVFEIAVMAFGMAALLSGRIEWMLMVVFLMGLHSAIFSPAKYGIVPEICRDEELSRANGLLEMSTFVAIVLASAVGSLLYAAWTADVEDGPGDAGGGGNRVGYQPAHHARRGIRFARAVPPEPVRRSDHRDEAPVEGPAAVAGRPGDLLLLVRGGPAADGPGAFGT